MPEPAWKMERTRRTAAADELGRAEDLLGQRRVREAIAWFDKAEAAGDNADLCRAGRWQSFMLAGDFNRAWLESDAIRRSAAPDPHFWDGSSLHGRRVIVRCLHGLGDAIQFLRYAPLIRDQASSLIVEVPPVMLELGRYFNSVEHVITWGDAAPPLEPEWDVQVEVMELPYLFRSTLASLPAPRSYLCLPQAMVSESEMNMRLNRRPRVGIAWAAGEWDCSRSIPFEMFAPLLAMGRDVSFVSLQKEEENGNWLEKARDLGMEIQAVPGNGLVPLAAVIANLDLVVTVDTMAAHLAAALGVPTWLLLQHRADWRWLLDRNDSPWYPSMRLFRQSVQGSWREVLEDVQGELLRYFHDWRGAKLATSRGASKEFVISTGVEWRDLWRKENS